MSEGSDVDPAELQAQLDQIKTAMAIDERYPGQRRMWLVYGVTIGLAAIATNASFVFDVPDPVYAVLWLGMAALVVGAQWRLVSRSRPDQIPGGVDWRVIGVGFVAAILALWTAIGELLGQNTTGALRGAHFFSHVILFMGLGFLVAGAVLRAEQVRLRDRLPFYLGGLWMLVLASIFPYVEFLQYWGYGVFGAGFLIHAVGTYLLTSD